MKTINKTYTNELNIKKSEFICRLIPATNEKEAKPTTTQNKYGITRGADYYRR